METFHRVKNNQTLSKIFVIVSLLLLCTTYIVRAGTVQQTAEEGQAIFEVRCISCHTIGGGNLVGPDLQGVTERRDLDWLAAFISVPDQMLADGDPIAVQLLEEFNNVAMPNMGVSETEAQAIIAFLESGITTDEMAASLPDGNAQRGSRLFLGGQSFQNGGTPCMGCHTVGGVGALGGGTLGPDLTQAYQRFGEAGLASSLQNIAFPTMQGIYVDKVLFDQEVADLLAFFAQADSLGEQGVAERFTGLFWAGGSIGAVVLFGVMAFLWPRQRESLSEKLRRQR